MTVLLFRSSSFFSFSPVVFRSIFVLLDGTVNNFKRHCAVNSSVCFSLSIFAMAIIDFNKHIHDEEEKNYMYVRLVFTPFDSYFYCSFVSSSRKPKWDFVGAVDTFCSDCNVSLIQFIVNWWFALIAILHIRIMYIGFCRFYSFFFPSFFFHKNSNLSTIHVCSLCYSSATLIPFICHFGIPLIR